MANDSSNNSENTIFQLIEFAQQYASGLDVLWTIFVGLAIAALFFLKPIYKAIFGEQDSSSTTVVVQNFDHEYFRQLIKEEIGARSTDTGEETDVTSVEVTEESGVDILQAIDQLSNLRKTFKVPELDPKIFPSDLDVLNFDANGKFRIRSAMSKGERVFIGLFCLPHYVIFPGIIGAVIFGSSVLGGVIGAALWVWRNWLGAYVSINFRKKKHALIMPAAASWHDGFPEVTLQSSYENNMWKTVLSIAGQAVIERESNVEKRHRDLEELAKSLRWRFGDSIEVAEGVYISP